MSRGAALSQGAVPVPLRCRDRHPDPGCRYAHRLRPGRRGSRRPARLGFRADALHGPAPAIAPVRRGVQHHGEELLAAWRDRTVRCLLLEDLEEDGRYTGTVALKGPLRPRKSGFTKAISRCCRSMGCRSNGGWRKSTTSRSTRPLTAITLESAGERLVVGQAGEEDRRIPRQSG